MACKYLKSLCCTPKTNIILEINNYISIKKENIFKDSL